MAFLLEMIAANEAAMPSPFIECIVFSTILGRSLAHQQELTIERVYGNMMANHCERQTWLDDTLSRQTLRLQQNYLSSSVKVESMLLFTSMVAQATALSLCKAAESISQASFFAAGLLSSGVLTPLAVPAFFFKPVLGFSSSLPLVPDLRPGFLEPL